MARKHVLVIVMPAFGHYIPGLELAKKIAPHHDVTLCISGYKVPDIKQRDLMPPAPIRLHGVADHLNFNLDERIHEMRESFQAMADLDPHYEAFIRALGDPSAAGVDLPPVSAIFVDATFPACIRAAHARGLPAFAFSPFSPVFLAHYGDIDEDTPTIAAESFLDGSVTDLTKVAIPDFMKAQAIRNYDALALSTAILFNSFQELEPHVMDLLGNSRRFASVPMKFIGPMLPTDEHLDRKKDLLEHRILDWLDTQAPASVTYFSFGTVAVPKPEQIAQVAAALTFLKRPFIWALRPFLQEHLPKEYTVSTADSLDPAAPYLIVPWAPQKRVLGHPAAGVFVSHCGWNSSLEAASYGVPVVGWPMFGDQHVNAIMLEQLGAGKTIKGTGVIGRVVPAEEIVEAIQTVAGWREAGDGKSPYRETMGTLGEKARATIGPAGQSTKNLHSVLNQI
ncbi:uncharacterized protein LOC129599752 [Paramacrobiotus metropolitanus]|uniref:uncharacterized protein LOC129599752 n=1 Tax=Paramacrobiotus metropolitanus TaxID=2943436 RepID=UPI002445FB69|nr:uncharacterized protein LOC129599752 [Paramacrobiotus metropolitanus]